MISTVKYGDLLEERGKDLGNAHLLVTTCEIPHSLSGDYLHYAGSVPCRNRHVTHGDQSGTRFP